MKVIHFVGKLITGWMRNTLSFFQRLFVKGEEQSENKTRCWKQDKWNLRIYTFRFTFNMSSGSSRNSIYPWARQMNVAPLTHQTTCSRSLLLLQAKGSGYFEKPASKVRIKHASLRWGSQVHGNNHRDHHNLNYFK